MNLSFSGWRRTRRSQPLPQPQVPAQHVDQSLVLAEIAQGKQRVAGRVEELKSLSERETLACGNVLSSIVDNVRDLITETDKTVAAAKARADEATSRFVGEMQQDAMKQEAAVKDVLVLADGVEEAIGSINGLTQYSNLLAINARIEAARLGEQGRGFAVIAQHMRDLSVTIRQSADKVSSAIEAVRQGLPPVGSRASSMHERTRGFVEALAEQAKASSLQPGSSSAHGGRLEGVMQLSNEALSHLQFQDPLVQNLSSINRDFDLLEGRVRRVLAGEVALAALSQDESTGAARPAPGKITLF